MNWRTKARLVKRKKNISKMKARETERSMKKIEEKNKTASFEIIFIGRSNVGKSTILNEITGEKLRTGKRPGVTLKPTHLYFDDLLVTDMPGFGFMNGVTEEKTEEVKTGIVRYIEDHKDRIKIAVLVIDGAAFEQIVKRWDERDEIPIDIELFSFITEFGISPIVAINKVDRIEKDAYDEKIDTIKKYYNEYNQNGKNVAFSPISAKRKETEALVKALRNELHVLKRNDLFKFFK